MPTAILPDRYTRENLLRALGNPRLFRRELFSLALSVNARASRLREFGDGAGVDVIAADWDNLILLDACRYDLFERRSTLDGELSAVRSKGSDSWEFMAANFDGRTLHDTVYVTANPHVYELEDDTFHAVVDLLESHWDEKTGTVLPEDVVEQTLVAADRYPEKRLIVHFMQPHFPFLGPTGREFPQQAIDAHLPEGERSEVQNPWLGLLASGEVDLESVMAAYRENFDLVIPHVAELLGALEGKSVVSADHGNLVGERGFPIPLRMYGHPRGLRHEGLLTVPWLEVESTDRRRIVAEPPLDIGTGADEGLVEERLRALGYV